MFTVRSVVLAFANALPIFFRTLQRILHLAGAVSHAKLAVRTRWTGLVAVHAHPAWTAIRLSAPADLLASVAGRLIGTARAFRVAVQSGTI